LFERFTDRARRVLVLAQEEAALLGHAEIATGHLLLGLISEGDGVAGRALRSLGVTLEGAREILGRRIISPRAAESGYLPFQPQAKKVLELTLREALQLGHNYVGTEHLLLGLARQGEQAGASVLELAGTSAGDVRAKVLEMLNGYTEAERSVPPQECRWRTGRRMGRTIHAQHGAKPSDSDPLIGIMDTPGLAAEACAAHNWAVTYRAALRRADAAPALDDVLGGEGASGEAADS
jgi:ATP-dependent Clp protease ATP-binding subunit ClpC